MVTPRELRHLSRRELGDFIARCPEGTQEYHVAMQVWRERCRRISQFGSVGLWGVLLPVFLVALLTLVRG